jgi:uncharacterized membrane protein
MGKGRLEAFSDGVIAVIITIMVLEMKAPHGHELSDMRPIIPIFLSYVLSFVYVAIYWVNHHHLYVPVRHVNGPTLWANVHLLFWLSLVPFVTSWMGENHFAPVPVSLYGAVMVGAAFAYTILARTLIRSHGRDSALAAAMGAQLKQDRKGNVSLLCYLIAIPAAFLSTWISGALYVAVAVIWLVPDKRIEHALESRNGEDQHENGKGADKHESRNAAH